MTKNAKAVLIAGLGVVLLGGIFAALAAVVIAAGLIAAAGGEGEHENRNIPRAGEDRGRKKSTGVSRGKSAGGGSLPAELVGRWLKREGGGETDFTGKSRYRSHRLYLYEFSADGSVTYTMDRETLTIMQCEVKERKTAGGTAQANGDTLTVSLDEGSVTGSDSCEGGEVPEKSLPAEMLNLKWTLKTEGERPELCLREASGEVCYAKQ